MMPRDDSLPDSYAPDRYTPLLAFIRLQEMERTNKLFYDQLRSKKFSDYLASEDWTETSTDGVIHQQTRRELDLCFLVEPSPHLSRGYLLFFRGGEGLFNGSLYQGCPAISFIRPLTK